MGIIQTYTHTHTAVQRCSAQSCVAAGYTSCCNHNDDPNNCEGRPLGFCFCDPSCTEYGDCCDDLADVCNPAKDALYASLEPQAVYTTTLSFQSAIVHWVSVPYINDSHAGQSDLIYTLHLSTPPSEVTYTSPVITRLSNHTSHNEVYSMPLSNLEPDTNYSYNLTAMTWYGDLQFKISGNFRTLDPSSLSVGELQLSVLTSSSVQVTWSPLALLPGVTVVGHVIRYQELPLGQETSLSINQVSNSYEVIGLKEGVVYSFVVMAIILEESGRVLPTGECTKSEIFISGSEVLQLTAVGSFSAHCTRWETADEEALLSAISSTVLSRIRGSLDPNYPSSNIRDGYIICHSPTPTHRLTYRARILATADLSITRLLRLLQTWSDNEFVIEQNTMLTTPLTTPILLLDSNCPVSVRTMAYPLCEAVDLSTPVALESGCVSVPIFVASLVALCLFLVVITMVIIVCILVWSQGTKIKNSVTGEARQDPPPAPLSLYNLYTPTPDTVATRQAPNGRPLALRVTSSASSGPTTTLQGGVALAGVVSGELAREFNSSQSLEEETQSEPVVTSMVVTSV
ncbi:uncharacterized protein LOC135334895 isoform X2 [Halichondria panicea]|uniref:uncharacterized protein LOC135334895 isoform X2 n=1 Tax=Halichondria panicea TaxID=6063 RepID=UPI00312B65B5